MTDKKRVLFKPDRDFICTAECGCMLVFHHCNDYLTWDTTMCPKHEHVTDDDKLTLIENCCLIRDYEIHEWNKVNGK